MDNKAVRKANIEHLIVEHGGPTQLGRAIEREQVQVSQWIGGKSIGDRLARHIEEKLGKPRGWLDVPQWRSTTDEEPGLLAAYQPVRPHFPTIAAAVAMVQAYLEIRREPPELVSDPILLETAYELVTEHGEAISESNVIDFVKRLSKRMQTKEAGDDVEQAAGAGTGRTHGKARR